MGDERTHADKTPGSPQNDSRPAPPKAPPTEPAPYLQRTIGNQAVQSLIQSSPGPTFGQWLSSLTNPPAPAPVTTNDLPSDEISTVTVPLPSLIRVPERQSLQTLFDEAVANPDDAQRRAQEVATNNTVAEYFEDKLSWPVQIERENDLNGYPRYTFSVYGEVLAFTQQPALPLDSFDPVSYEPLRVVNDRIAAQTFQVVTAAMIQVAYSSLAQDDLPTQVAKNPEEYALNYIGQQGQLAQDLFERTDLVLRTLDPSNEWLRFPFGVQHQQIRMYRDRMQEAWTAAYHYLNDDPPSKAHGAVYDEAIESAESGGFFSHVFGGGALKIGRFAGNVVTGGGQSLDAQNYAMYMRGEISYNAFKKNRLLNIGRVGVTAIITAATAGRVSGPAMRFLGLEAGTTAAAITGATVEGMVQGLATSFSSDAYSYLLANVTSDPGVAAFHEATIGGPMAWLESTAWGGIIGGGSAVLASLIPKSPLDPTKLRREAPTGSPIGDEANTGWRIISADEQTGAITLSVRHPTTGELFIVQADAYLGDGVMTNASTGEVVGYYRAGKFGPVSSGGALATSAEVAPAGLGRAPVEETGLVSVSDDIDSMIRQEMTPVEPSASLYSVKEIASPEPPPTSWEEALNRVDTGKIPSTRLAELKNHYVNYLQKWKPRWPAQRPLTLDEYVRFRSGQFVSPLKALEPKFAAEVGRVAEQTWAEAVESPRNPGVTQGGRFSTPWANVEPDFMPAVGASGETEFARNAGYAAQHGLPGIGDALVIADSKYFGVFEPVQVINITNQIRGMIWLSRLTKSRTFVALIRPGQTLAKGIIEFANQYQVTVQVHTHWNVQ